ncbi:type I-B CRISPR-associated protein Cas8b1/Cst1 [Alkalicella caledoniensis]|uniref:Type I-B CRISPR-associated protein Cas8b1/Cst1 n=1 Tax=Alkalicella caledoniensis TaxID=2731377 RepID=A0A7G9W4X2_ALKCA|nr:type I-B CRISPR-associated protein Cas8b1/Cst1 [Alkalicella caledoniensis]QNO13734.1 type I-B CRISPR-associated protein Cas8b1/Cst1 [Alkalicella caledoniensis]
MTKMVLEMNDWLFNAGLVGFINILKHSEDDITVKEQNVEFKLSVLEGFENKFFTYLIDKYENTLSWYKIVSYEENIKYHNDTNFQEFTEKELIKMNEYLKYVLKYYLSSNSYKAAYPLLENGSDTMKFAKNIDGINLKKNEVVKDRLDDVKEVFTRIQEVISICKRPEYKKYLAAKNVIYNIVKHSWDGVCFLNKQTKEINNYKDYKQYFVKTVEDFAEQDTSKFKYKCFNCHREMKDLNNDLSFINNIGFDVSRKPSHVWEFNNDIAICPVCKLIYSCIPAGFTYVQSKGIFVNDNNSLDRAIRINNRIKSEVHKGHEINRNTTFKGLVASIQEQFRESVKYELADIQVVNLKEDKYMFNILSKRLLNVIKDCQRDLDAITNAGFREVKTYFSIYELAIERVFNNQNMFTLVNKLLTYKLSIPKECRFSNAQVIKLLRINSKILEGMGYMDNNEKDFIKIANASGYYLREEYKSKGSKDKLNGISYRLLNALKTNNKDMFMDTVLNCYLYTQKKVPSVFLEALKDDILYKTIGYSFVTGLIEGKENKIDGGVKND